MQGKAAIDVVGSQMGKSSSSILQQALLLLSGGSMSIILPIMTLFQVGILNRWMAAVDQLGSFYNEAMKKEAEAKAAPTGEAGADEGERRGGTEPVLA